MTTNAATTAEPTTAKTNFEDPAIVRRLRADLRDLTRTLGRDEVRGLIETYYMLQGDRIQTGNRLHALRAGASVEQPRSVLHLFNAELHHLELLMRAPIESYVKAQRAGRWLLSQKGIGPILAGALLAHIDITRARSAGSLERYAGIDPTLEWKPGTRRPFNADLKKTLWLLTESFVKVSNRDGAYYGAYYRERKTLELERNERGELADAAARYRERRTARNAPDAEWAATLDSGRLPPFLIDKRARRKVQALFVNHLFEVLYTCEYGAPPPFRPWVIDVAGHKTYLPVPDWPIA